MLQFRKRRSHQKRSLELLPVARCRTAAPATKSSSAAVRIRRPPPPPSTLIWVQMQPNNLCECSKAFPGLQTKLYHQDNCLGCCKSASQHDIKFLQLFWYYPHRYPLHSNNWDKCFPRLPDQLLPCVGHSDTSGKVLRKGSMQLSASKVVQTAPFGLICIPSVPLSDFEKSQTLIQKLARWWQMRQREDVPDQQ